MTNQTEAGQEETIITLEGEDGHSYKCQILDIFDFENNEYALLLKIPGEQTEAADEDEESLVIMRLTQKEDQSIFQTIESDEEFNKVVAYVEEQVKQNKEPE